MERNTSNELVNTFEYSFPICDDGNESGGDSNKSTPYYTPLEFFQSSNFEFPATEKVATPPPPTTTTTTTAAATTTTKTTLQLKELSSLDTTTEIMDVAKSPIPSRHIQGGQSGIKQGTTSPAVSRKLRRFSLYERRSCSPQHLLMRNTAGSVDFASNELPSPVDDKENAKPIYFFEQARDELVQVITRSGNSSPIILKDDSASPKIPTSDGISSRHNFSPKLLASINNLKLANSPLGIISSAGYKNGNYFKFPEIDNVVNDSMGIVETTHDIANQYYDTQNRGGGGGGSFPTMRFITSNLDNGQPIIDSNATVELPSSKDKSIAMNTRKNRKNKNNLTIQITDTPVGQNLSSVHSPLPSPSSSPKPKTPTIKTTKEKALSLDSAPCETGLSIVIQSGESQIQHLSCDEIDSKMHFSSGNNKSSNNNKNNNNNTNNNNNNNNTNNNNNNNNNNNSQQRSRIVGSRERLRPAITSNSSKSSASTSPAVYRTPHKPSPLLHSSNTNLKTLPEFLTLVEFSTSSPKERELCAFKQKSMDLPSTAIPNIRSKSSASPSGSLLQRRGSNHSLTLNLHGSCGNLVGSCRGLSVSNYSLGSSAANSTTSLCAKSSRQGNEITANTLQPNVHLTTQGAKQSLFRRRGSNQSFTLKNSATSCGNLNALVSQNSLNVDRNLMHVSAGGGGGGGGGGSSSGGLGLGLGGGGVTRTTSFITPTHNTMTPKRGLLERRGSNQSLTLNMGSSFGGGGGGVGVGGLIGADRNAFLSDESFQRRYDKLEPPNRGLLPQYCAQHHRKFLSSENLNNQHTQTIEMISQTERRAFGSASDLKAGGSPIRNATKATNLQPDQTGNLTEESNICTCSGMRNIMTRPLSPQRKAEEFKTYLANIQTLQNASNVLKQHELIKLNYIFDNSYASSRKSLQEVLPPIVLGVEPNSANSTTKDNNTPISSTQSSGSLLTTSEDSEIAARYEEAAKAVLDSLQIDVAEQKRIFCELHKEFWDLPLNHQEKPLVFGSQAKNRYKTILPNETTRVMLQQESMEWKYFGINTKNSEEVAEKAEKISSYGTGNKLLIASAETPYINANYIKGPDGTNFSYVATQGPLPNTIFEFWLMVFQNARKNDRNIVESNRTRLQQYYQKIVMLTNFQEHNRQKCVVYFPVELNEIFIATSKQEVLPHNDILNGFFEKYLSRNDSADESEPFIEHFIVDELNDEVNANLPQTGNCFVIKNVGIVRKNGYSIRKMIVLYCMIQQQQQQSVGCIDDENLPRLCIQRFCCYHYWYPDWPDHRSPRDINTLVDICIHILNLGKCEAEFDDCGQIGIQLQKEQSSVELYQQDLFNSLQPLPIIHCSAGVGRTGCLTAILNGIRQMRQTFAYSLASMAAELNNEKNIKSTQPSPPPPSPIDFRLPKEYYESFANNDDDAADDDDDDNNDTILACNSDTDSSFTRNTLLYIKYISHQQHGAPTSSSSSHKLNVLLPSLMELPRMPDIVVDILGIVCNLRLSRGGMVQNSEQYELIHRALCLYLKRTLALKRF